jgi:dTDP-4-dehydrorhamnose reductase
MKRVIVLGGSGMLGSMVADVLSGDPGLAVTATVRPGGGVALCQQALPGVRWVGFEAGEEEGLHVLEGHDWVVNAIGITKPLIRDDNPLEVERAIRVNSLFPQRLAARARDYGARVLQIATDCVYSGQRGAYVEGDPHDALDVYGKTKSLGESVQPWVHNLRCSIIGREPKDFKFLVEWLLRQPPGAEVTGFTNHRWNGVTTYHFARLAQGIVNGDPELPNLQHLVPADELTKAQMLEVIATAYQREDIRIRRAPAEKVIDRTLRTARPDVSSALWRLAGYAAPPTVTAMIAEMAAHPNHLAAAGIVG